MSNYWNTTEHSRTPYSELNRAYDSPYYQPLTQEQEGKILKNLHNEYRSEAVSVYRNNLMRLSMLGTMAYVASYPLNRLVLMQQVRPDVRFLSPEINYRWSALKFIIQKEGPHHLWRGVLPGALYWSGCIWGHFVISDAFERPQLATTTDEFGSLEDIMMGTLYTSALSAWQMAIHPLRVVNTKLATDIRVKHLGTWYKYATSIDCALRIVRYNGIVGLYRGAMLTAFRNYLLWITLYAFNSELQAEDNDGSEHEVERFWPFIYPFRYEWRALQAYMFLFPIETIVARRIYRLPTFKTDKMPKQFPRMYLPTFGGFISIYRGLNAFALVNIILLLFSRWMEKRAEEELLPDHLKPSNENLLYQARYALYRRHKDELMGEVAQYPHVDPYNTGSTARMREEYVGETLDRFQIPSIAPRSGIFKPYPDIDFHGGEMALPDVQGLHRGNYDASATTFVPPSAASPHSGSSIATNSHYDRRV